MDNKNLHILFVLDLYSPHIGWVEILFENIISRLEKKDVEITILTSRFSSKVPKYEKISKNIEIYRSWWNRYIFMLSWILLWIKLAKKVDIIHTTTYNAAFPAYVIWKFSRKKVIITVHEIFWKLWYNFMWWKWFFFKLYEDFIFKLWFEKYICVSNYTKNSLRLRYGISDKKLTTIYNGIDYVKWDKDNFQDSAIKEIIMKHDLNTSYCWLYFGRPWISKWLEYYVESIPMILKKIPNFRAVCIVPGNDSKRISIIKNIISKLWIEKNIIWIAWVENSELWNYILACDFVIVPSLAEWFGFSAAESCALEKNIVVCEVASLPEVVSGKVCFVEPGNSESIAKWIIQMHKWKYQKIPKKDFPWEKNVSATIDIYEEILWKSS